ncbi:MAG TPA: metallophosphoesterase [Edaphobacter sp.]|uniref:metallophosphoesterase n=1 Tax=Edaphobacter sp. TaxID=1934404 RepID=UPI002BCED712|nr:metallophosphoesterase [Edaphobacter sp.]HUZ97399.1 metallophosphoesterase [Edaphobacter sp.]
MLSRRGFLRQSFAFSALAGFSSLPSFAKRPSHKPNAGATQLLMVGDWGYENFAAQSRVAGAMQQYVREHGLTTDALLMLGDNWYGKLPDGAASERWKTQFEDMYPKSVFNCAAYAIAGNHDYQKMPESKVAAELEYARKGGTRWTMPSLWYRFDFPAVNPLMTVIALDSNMPHPQGQKTKPANFTLTPEQQAEQLTWLEAELLKPRTTPFLVVMGHHPIFSNGPHGDNAVLIRDWEPLLRKHKAHLYLAGHDHDMQHLEFDGHPTSFVLSGGGGADLYPLKIEEAQRGPYAAKVYGFSHLEVTPEKMTLRHLDETGKLIHAFDKMQDGSVKIV